MTIKMSFIFAPALIVWGRLLCCSAPLASSSEPIRPTACYPSIGLVVNIVHIRTFCDHINVLHMVDKTSIVLKSALRFTAARMLASSLDFPCLRLTPRRHHQADGQLKPLSPPSPSFSSFGDARVKLYSLPPPSLVRNTCLCCPV